MLALFFQKNDEIQFETEINLDPELWLINGDSGKLEQSILNIIMNAKDAMPEGGRITITTCNVKNPEGHNGEHICISIKDTGIGMEQDIIDHIFDPFFTTKGPKGTGLGLSLVNQIIEELKGWIEVSSEVNKGTTFSLFIPAFKK
jgi:signal transduction histidine kinase